MERDSRVIKVDMHVHSEHSNAPYSWLLRSANAAECYTRVEMVYDIAKSRGMDLVTLCDHDVIDGALALREMHPHDTFVSVEVSARFPEDGCIVHTIAADVTEPQHREMQRLRRNIYELVPYMDQQGIHYFWCHPLSQVNHRLTRTHIERCFLMFRILELRNGTRDIRHETRLRDLVDRITPALLSRWAEKHPQTPVINTTGRYAFVGGSDDHGSIAIARAYTSFRGESTAAGLRAALDRCETECGGEAGHASTLAHNCYGVAAGYLRSSGQLSLARGTAPANANGKTAVTRTASSPALVDALGRYKALFDQAGGRFDAGELSSRGHTDAFQNALREKIDVALVRGWRAAMGRVVGALAEARVAEAADGFSDLIKAALLELPYLLASRYHVRDRNGADRYYRELCHATTRAHPRVAVITDSLDNVDGVALGLRRLSGEARRWGLALDLVGAGDGDTLHVGDDGIVRVPRIYEHRLAEYPQYGWSVPHLPSLLRYLSDREVDLVQVSTPGPMGVAGLLAARLTGLPVIGQFHTDVPEYALRLTGDPTVAAMVGQLVAWFYRATDRVLVPSHHVAGLVREMGVPADRVTRIPRGIDLELFHPGRRDPRVWDRYEAGRGPKILYVGRISKEKSLDCLMRGFQDITEAHPDARLVLVGDGPHTDALRAMAPEGRVLFTGTVTGERLATLYASSDVFVFPSETETFGNAVVEAQASGLPVIVSDKGAAREHVIERVTGFVTRDAASIVDALDQLLRNAPLRERMAEAGAQLGRRYDMVEAVRGTFRAYARILDDTHSSGERKRALA